MLLFHKCWLYQHRIGKFRLELCISIFFCLYISHPQLYLSVSNPACLPFYAHEESVLYFLQKLISTTCFSSVINQLNIQSNDLTKLHIVLCLKVGALSASGQLQI